MSNGACVNCPHAEQTHMPRCMAPSCHCRLYMPIRDNAWKRNKELNITRYPHGRITSKDMLELPERKRRYESI